MKPIINVKTTCRRSGLNDYKDRFNSTRLELSKMNTYIQAKFDLFELIDYKYKKEV